MQKEKYSQLITRLFRKDPKTYGAYKERLLPLAPRRCAHPLHLQILRAVLVTLQTHLLLHGLTSLVRRYTKVKLHSLNLIVVVRRFQKIILRKQTIIRLNKMKESQATKIVLSIERLKQKLVQKGRFKSFNRVYKHLLLMHFRKMLLDRLWKVY